MQPRSQVEATVVMLLPVGVSCSGYRTRVASQTGSKLAQQQARGAVAPMPHVACDDMQTAQFCACAGLVQPCAPVERGAAGAKALLTSKRVTYLVAWPV